MRVSPTASSASLLVHLEKRPDSIGSFTAFQMHTVKGIHSCILDRDMPAPHQTQHLVKRLGRCWHTLQAELDHHTHGLRDVRVRTRGQKSAQPRLSRIDQFHELQALGIAISHSYQSLALALALLARVAFGILLRKAAVDLVRNRLARHRLGFQALALWGLSILVLVASTATHGLQLLLCLASLFGIELLEADGDLLQQLLCFFPLVAGSLQCWTIGVELNERADKLHRGLACGARSVLHAARRDLQHAGPLLAGKSNDLCVCRQTNQCLQHAVAHPHTFVERTCHQSLKKILLRRCGNREVCDRRAFVLHNDRLHLLVVSIAFLTNWLSSLFWVLLLPRCARPAVAVRAARQLPPLR
mmetsp:Transcript_35056/g.88352  ORF Transcript_35056/g.88352 Transcript_35056/m.88352 type:complete len:358 (-) Transcript_35056:1232-2305(-)